MSWFWKLFGWVGKLGQLLDGLKTVDAGTASAEDYEPMVAAIAADPRWPEFLERVREKHGEAAVVSLVLAAPYMLWAIDYLAEAGSSLVKR